MKKLSALIIAVIFSAMLVLSSACNIIAKGDLTSADPTQSTQSSSDPSDEPKPSGRAVDLMSDVTSAAVESVSLGVEYADAYNAFAAKLFNLLYEGKNELISPLSIELALSMTANGADGATKTQMENVLFSGGDVDKFNAYNRAYIKSLESVKDISVKVANSIWFKDDPLFSVEQGFLQANADYYNAGAFKAPFDLATLADINGWVSDKTDGMINKIIDDISKDAVMYLINALLFDAEWAEPFNPAFPWDFTTAAGTKKTVDMLHGETYGYLENEVAEGFMNSYKGGRFRFVAMLPKQGQTVKSVIESLTGESLSAYFKSGVFGEVVFKMPKFKLDYSAELAKQLKSMGMTDAFDAKLADLSRLGTYGTGNLYIDSVIHKTAIEVTEAGTKAAAVTAVIIAKATSAGPGGKVYYIDLDRPFIYFLLDTQTNIPLFMGAYEN